MTIYDKGMRILLEIIVCFIAGMGAGLGTGFAGMSAAAVISPMLITFLGMPAYQAVGIALASDVLASAASAYTYGKNKNLDIRNGLIMMAAVLVMTMVGSWLASLMPDSTMGSFSVIMTFLLGVKFIARPVMTTKELMNGVSKRVRLSVLGYELKTAVGTSVFIMTFTAFTGAVSHFTIGGMPDISCLVLCIIFTLIWAEIAARFANKAEPITLNRVTGAVLVILGLIMIGVNLL